MNAAHSANPTSAAPVPQFPLLTIATLRLFNESAATRTLRHEIKIARARARTTRLRVDSYTMPLFASFGFVHARTGEPLANPQRLYLAGPEGEELEARVAEYYAACDAANAAHGHDVPTGYCPALIAEHAATAAESALLAHAETILGVDLRTAPLDLRTRGLELFLNPLA